MERKLYLFDDVHDLELLFVIFLGQEDKIDVYKHNPAALGSGGLTWIWFIAGQNYWWRFGYHTIESVVDLSSGCWLFGFVAYANSELADNKSCFLRLLLFLEEKVSSVVHLKSLDHVVHFRLLSVFLQSYLR